MTHGRFTRPPRKRTCRDPPRGEGGSRPRDGVESLSLCRIDFYGAIKVDLVRVSMDKKKKERKKRKTRKLCRVK